MPFPPRVDSWGVRDAAPTVHTDQSLAISYFQAMPATDKLRKCFFSSHSYILCKRFVSFGITFTNHDFIKCRLANPSLLFLSKQRRLITSPFWIKTFLPSPRTESSWWWWCVWKALTQHTQSHTHEAKATEISGLLGHPGLGRCSGTWSLWHYPAHRQPTQPPSQAQTLKLSVPTVKMVVCTNHGEDHKVLSALSKFSC